MEADKTDPQGLRDRAILETMYSAGLRVGELVGLDVDDWDRDAGILRVFGKGRKERIAPVGDYATRALLDWMEVRKPNAKGKADSTSAIFLIALKSINDSQYRSDAGEISQTNRFRDCYFSAYTSP
ncbi:MAG: tyrosine-type recombinase/integrase [Planctomycetaceae bacterium]